MLMGEEVISHPLAPSLLPAACRRQAMEGSYLYTNRHACALYICIYEEKRKGKSPPGFFYWAGVPPSSMHLRGEAVFCRPWRQQLPHLEAGEESLNISSFPSTSLLGPMLTENFPGQGGSNFHISVSPLPQGEERRGHDLMLLPERLSHCFLPPQMLPHTFLATSRKRRRCPMTCREAAWDGSWQL